MTYIGYYLTEVEYKKAVDFVKRIKPILMTRDCQFMKSEKNKRFDERFSLRHDQKVDIIKTLTADDCIKIAPNDNIRYAESEVYQFIKCVNLSVYGENEEHKLYIKMYKAEKTNYDIVIVISLHEEGEYE